MSVEKSGERHFFAGAGKVSCSWNSKMKHVVKHDVNLNILLECGVDLCNKICLFQAKLEVLVILQTPSSRIRHRYVKSLCWRLLRQQLEGAQCWDLFPYSCGILP